MLGGLIEDGHFLVLFYALQVKRGDNQLKKILARSILYFTLAVVISIAVIRQDTNEFGVKIFFTMSLLFIYIIAFYDIAIHGDKCIKTIEPQLYSELKRLKWKYDPKPLFISSHLILSGRFRFYPKLNLIILATMFYYLSVAVLIVDVILILT